MLQCGLTSHRYWRYSKLTGRMPRAAWFLNLVGRGNHHKSPPDDLCPLNTVAPHNESTLRAVAVFFLRSLFKPRAASSPSSCATQALPSRAEIYLAASFNLSAIRHNQRRVSGKRPHIKPLELRAVWVGLIPHYKACTVHLVPDQRGPERPQVYQPPRI